MALTPKTDPKDPNRTDPKQTTRTDPRTGLQVPAPGGRAVEGPGGSTPADQQTAYSPVDTEGNPKAVGGEDMIQAGVIGSDPQAVEFDYDPEVKEQLSKSGSYRPLPPGIEPYEVRSPMGDSVPRSLADPGVGQKSFSGHGGAGPDVLEPNAKENPDRDRAHEPVSKEAGKKAVEEPSHKTPEHRK